MIERNEAAHAAAILRGVLRAMQFADQESGDGAAVSDWLVLIEAATNHALSLLEGEPAGADEVSP